MSCILLFAGSEAQESPNRLSPLPLRGLLQTPSRLLRRSAKSGQVLSVRSGHRSGQSRVPGQLLLHSGRRYRRKKVSYGLYS